MRIRIIGVGMGPQHVTPEAARALQASAYAVAAVKRDGDPLFAVREEICRLHGDLPIVAVPDPARDRDDPQDYGMAVRDWHEARADAWATEIDGREGDPAFLVWGDPALYDSTIRIVRRIAPRLGAEVEVIAGISAPQLLAARHGIVLHEVGQPVLVTTERRLPEALRDGHENIVVMLTSGAPLPDPVAGDRWSIWWGANLGAVSERLVAGRVGEVADEIAEARQSARDEAGWVMDAYLLRAG